MSTNSLARRFWSKVDKTATCWLWHGVRGPKGYGRIRKSGKGSPMVYAHRLSWEMINGPIPGGLCVLHDCPSGDNPSCVNPDHLFLGTVRDNNEDMLKKGRYRFGARHPAVRLSEVDVRAIREATGPRGIVKILTKTYGVSQSTISMIRTGRNWRSPENRECTLGL